MPFETQWFRVVPTSHTYTYAEDDGRGRGGQGHRSGGNTNNNNNNNTNVRIQVLQPNDTRKQETKSSLARAQSRLEKAKRVVETLETKFTTKMTELERLKNQVKSAEEEVAKARRERDVRLTEWECEREWEWEKEKEMENKRRQDQERERERERAKKAARRMVQVFFT